MWCIVLSMFVLVKKEKEDDTEFTNCPFSWSMKRKAKLQCHKVKRQKLICRVNVATMTSHSSCIISLYRTWTICAWAFFFPLSNAPNWKIKAEPKYQKSRLIIKCRCSEFLGYCSLASFVFLWTLSSHVNTFRKICTICSPYSPDSTSPQSVIVFWVPLLVAGIAPYHSLHFIWLLLFLWQIPCKRPLSGILER